MASKKHTGCSGRWHFVRTVRDACIHVFPLSCFPPSPGSVSSPQPPKHPLLTFPLGKKMVVDPGLESFFEDACISKNESAGSAGRAAEGFTHFTLVCPFCVGTRTLVRRHQKSQPALAAHRCHPPPRPVLLHHQVEVSPSRIPQTHFQVSASLARALGGAFPPLTWQSRH